MNMDSLLSDGDILSMIDAVTDNQGKTADRFTVFFGDGDVLGMSDAPTHPQGFSQWSEGHFDLDDHDRSGEKIAFDDLPEDIQAHVFSSIREGYRGFCEIQRTKGKSVVDIRQEIMDCY